MDRATGGTAARRLGAAVAFVLLCVVLVWGGGAAAGASPSPAPEVLTARFGTTVDADDLDPFLGRNSTAYEIFHLNYDFLVGYDTDLSPRPELATSWEVTPDGKTWTFHLRSGVTWQDGEPFTAEDVAFTYNYIIRNGLTAFTSSTNGIEEAVVVDPLTVEMRCSRPKADMLRLWVPILPRHIWSKVPGRKAGTDFVAELPIVGTGPFQTVAVKKGESIKLVKNPHYWRPGKPHIDELVFQVYQDADAMTQDLRAGSLDYAQGVPAARFDALQAQPGLHANAADLPSFDGIAMNCYDSPDSLGHPALRDPRFRQALAWAVDKQTIVELSYGGYALPGQSLIAPGVPAYFWHPAVIQQTGFDLIKASRLLEEAGYPLVAGARLDKQGRPITLRLWARADDAAGQSTGSLVAGWFRRLGLRVDFRTPDSGTISQALYNYAGGKYAPDYDLYVGGWSEYVDPDSILGVFTTAQIGGRNDACWSDEEYDRLYQQQARTIDPGARKPLVDRMAELFYTEAPLIVTSYQQQLEAYNTTKWEGWTQAPSLHGPVAFVNDNIDTYVNLRLKPAPAPQGGGGVSTAVYVAVAVGVLGVAVATVLLLRRGRARALED